ncbi:MAG: diguanylate cyclase [Planctomycetota bacterium]
MKFLFEWKLPVIARITIGLVGLLASVLMAISFLGLFPDPQTESLRTRKQFCETAAIGFSLMAERANVETMRTYLESLAARGEDLVCLGVRRDDGDLVVETGDHATHWIAGDAEGATDSQIWVRFFSQGKPWGTFEAVFTPLKTKGWLGAFRRPEIAHTLLVTFASLCVFYIYLRMVLRHLDPSQVIPNRVRDALNSLAEGLLILDRNERIVLANSAFEDATGCRMEQLLGSPVDKITFVSRDDVSAELTPWREAINSSKTITGRLLGFERDGALQRTFSVSASPIVDERGSSRGILASFEDVTNLEKKKRDLTEMVDYLRASSDAIKEQNRELERLATRDPLTGCLNRRAFFDRFDSEWKGSQRYAQPLCAMMVDIDFFKSINDNHGHSMGDEVLRKVAHTLRSLARETDVVCRYGGEEFSVLLPMTGIDEAAKAAERFRAAIEKLHFPDFAITTSIGVSAYSVEINAPQDLLDRADKCLYVAKRSGRNQVVRWDDVPADLVVDESQISRTKAPEVGSLLSIPYHAVTALTSALGYRDQITAAHSRRVADLCVSCAEGLLSLKDRYTLEVAALLHDIGKIGVPDNILLKAGPLTAEEWEFMCHHQTIGKEIIRASFGLPQLTAIVEHYQAHYGNPAVRPCSPTGNQIPVSARILAIADAFDAMTTDRVYRKGRTVQQAFAELRRCAGEQFDPELVERFIAMVERRQSTELPRSQTVSKENALVIGMQIERLSEVLDEQDFDALDSMAQRLHLTAHQCGADCIGDKARELKGVLDSDRDPHSILEIANELLDLCRSTQGTFLALDSHPASASVVSPSPSVAERSMAGQVVAQ